MGNWKDRLSKLIPELQDYISQIVDSEKILLGMASPPKSPGAYIIYDHNDELRYIGEAKGSGGLRDRLLNKHISGDDSHAIQRAYIASYPDRQTRRKFIKNHLKVQWVVTKDPHTAAAVERILIVIFNPQWNLR